MYRRVLPASIVCAFLALTGCKPKEQAGTPADSMAATSAAAPAAPAAPNVVTVHAREYAFDLPKEIPAGLTTFNLMNDGSTFHHMMIARLDSGKTVAELQKAITQPGPPPAWFVLVGGPNAPDPKAESNATVNMTPGNYVVLCMVDTPNRVAHYSKGMITTLTVTPNSAPAAPAPTPDVVITAEDYKYTLSKPLTAGKHTIEFHVANGQPHEIEIFKLAPGKTMKDVQAWAKKYQGPPPFVAIGGISPALAGSVASFTADFTPGDYLLICFLPDAKDRKPHFLHGMAQTVTVS